MAFSTASTLLRLGRRKDSLIVERGQLSANFTKETERIDAQIASIDSVISTLRDAGNAKAVDSILGALESAGVRIEVSER